MHFQVIDLNFNINYLSSSITQLSCPYNICFNYLPHKIIHLTIYGYQYPHRSYKFDKLYDVITKKNADKLPIGLTILKYCCGFKFKSYYNFPIYLNIIDNNNCSPNDYMLDMPAIKIFIQHLHNLKCIITPSACEYINRAEFTDDIYKKVYIKPRYCELFQKYSHNFINYESE